MSVDLPTTGNSSAREIAVWCSDSQLGRAIAYLELVKSKQINPGPEIERLFGENTLLSWTFEEVIAVQHKLALALCIRRGLGYVLTQQMRENVFRYRTEVLTSYHQPFDRCG